MQSKLKSTETFLLTKDTWHFEQGKKLIDRINHIKNCGIGRRFMQKSFANYNKDRNPEAYNLCLEYVRDIENNIQNGRGLFLTGDVGTGKTHLAIAIIDYIARLKKRDWHYTMIYVSAVDLLANIRMSYNSGGTEEIVRQYEDINLLIIDDIGVEKTSDWVHEMFYKIIDHRYNELKPMIIISNLRGDEINEKLSERIMSRVYEMCKGVKFKGKDYRVLKGNK